MTRESDEEDFLRLFPDVRRLERSVAFRNFRAARRQFDLESPGDGEENNRKAMKVALYASAYIWLVPAAILGVPGAVLVSFHSNVVMDVLAAVLLVPVVGAYAMYMNRIWRARSIYPGKARASWAGFWPPIPDDG